MALLLGAGDFGLGDALAAVALRPMKNYTSIAAAHQALMPALAADQKGFNVTITIDGETAEFLKTADGVSQLTAGSPQTS